MKLHHIVLLAIIPYFYQTDNGFVQYFIAKDSVPEYRIVPIIVDDTDRHMQNIILPDTGTIPEETWKHGIKNTNNL